MPHAIIAHHSPTKKAIMAAAYPYHTAVAIRGRFAAFVSFQWQSASHPPDKKADSAVLRELPACYFSGNYAIFA